MTAMELQHQILQSTKTCDTPGVVLLSGGQDSVTCLHYALRRHSINVHALSFDYGQRHSVELRQAAFLANKYGIPHVVLDVGALRDVGQSALTGPGDVGVPHAAMAGVPASFVPARNAIFLTLAYSYAQMIGGQHVYGGMCQTDYSGYPDCREEFVQALSHTLNIGYPGAAFISFVTPMMRLTKCDTFALAEALGVQALHDVVEHSHTCYEGDRSTRHVWGYGCGKCPACQLRAKGWDDFNLTGRSK